MITWDEIRESRRDCLSWKKDRDTQYRASERPLEREKPLLRHIPLARWEQGELEEIVAPIDEHEAFIRHKKAMALRWFGYYRKCKKSNMDIVRQYNRIAGMRERQ